MGVGPPETEAVDTDGQGAAFGERPRCQHHVHIGLVEVQLRVEAVDTDGGGDEALGQATQRLVESGDAGRCLQVADVALDRADRQWVVTMSPKGLADGGDFDGISDGGAGPMGFQVVQSVGIDPRPGVDLGQQLGLNLSAGYRES